MIINFFKSKEEKAKKLDKMYYEIQSVLTAAFEKVAAKKKEIDLAPWTKAKMLMEKLEIKKGDVKSIKYFYKELNIKSLINNIL